LKIQRTDIFIKWFEKLKNKQVAIAIVARIRMIEDRDYLGKTYPITNGISEMKFEMGAGYRIYFNIYTDGNEVWFLTGGDKSTQNRDIEIAKLLLKELQKERKKDNGKNYDYER
jgi:putative addiction module killer protein